MSISLCVIPFDDSLLRGTAIGAGRGALGGRPLVGERRGELKPNIELFKPPVGVVGRGRGETTKKITMELKLTISSKTYKCGPSKSLEKVVQYQEKI